MHYSLSFITLFASTALFAAQSNIDDTSLIPDAPPSKICNYFCTWAAQGYVYGQGKDQLDVDVLRGPNGVDYCREAMNQKSLTEGADAWLKFYPEVRSDLWFMLDDGHAIKAKDKSIIKSIDPEKFPACAGKDDTESLKTISGLVKAAGWHGLGIWIGDAKAKLGEKEIVSLRDMMGRFQKAGVGYCKVDTGDETMEFCKAGTELAPDLTLEHSVWMHGVYTGNGETDMKSLLPSVFAPQNHSYLRGTNVVRIYDCDQPMGQITALLRTSALLNDANGDKSATAIINTEDHVSIAGGLGCSFGILRFPISGKRPDGDVDIFNGGPRHVKKRMDEVVRVVRWQRLAPPLPACALPVIIDEKGFADRWNVTKVETWNTRLGLIAQSAPARISRGLPLPEVKCEGDAPFVLACRHPQGPVTVTTLGRFGNAWGYRIPLADITLEAGSIPPAIGIFGRYRSLTLTFSESVEGHHVVAQDLKANRCGDITGSVILKGNSLTIPGEVINRIGLSAATPGDESDPGMVLKILP